ncbi:DNA-binding protein [Candidatus Parcubacteria bacterium]|nr:MAG: DNA-binding protein [Candidatus Parcubacteria bacterium]
MTEIAVLPKDELKRMLEKAAARGAELALRSINPPENGVMTGKPLSAKEVAEMIGVPYNRLMTKLINQPHFPKPYLGTGKGQRKLWRESDILQWMTRFGGAK